MPLSYSTTHWPDVLGQTYRKVPLYTTLRTPSTGAGDQRLTVDGPAYRFLLGFTALDRFDASRVQVACDYLAAGWGQLWFWEWRSEPHVNSVTSTATDSYTLPATSVTSLVARVNGILTSCSVDEGAGPLGQDVATFGSATLPDLPVTFEFEGRYLRRVRLDQSSITLTDRQNDSGVWQATVTLVETAS